MQTESTRNIEVSSGGALLMCRGHGEGRNAALTGVSTALLARLLSWPADVCTLSQSTKQDLVLTPPKKIGYPCSTRAYKTIDIKQTFDALSGTQKINQSND